MFIRAGICISAVIISVQCLWFCLSRSLFCTFEEQPISQLLREQPVTSLALKRYECLAFSFPNAE